MAGRPCNGRPCQAFLLTSTGSWPRRLQGAGSVWSPAAFAGAASWSRNARVETAREGGGGKYPTRDGFGRTNRVFMALIRACPDLVPLATVAPGHARPPPRRAGPPCRPEAPGRLKGPAHAAPHRMLASPAEGSIKADFKDKTKPSGGACRGGFQKHAGPKGRFDPETPWEPAPGRMLDRSAKCPS